MNTFDDFWNAYDKKVGIDKCKTKWALITPTDQILIMNHVHGFVANHRNKQYRPNPLSYLNGKMWLNEEIKDEETVYYTPSKPQVLSTYKAPVPTEQERTDFIVGKIKQAYNGELNLNDIGEVYTNRLKDHLSTPFEVLEKIQLDVLELISKEPRNRFEEKVFINQQLEVRNRVLQHNFKQWREANNRIYEKI